MKEYSRVVDYIIKNAVGRNNAIIGRIIGDRFGISGIKVRASVNEARCDGIPICSCRNGYYYSIEKSDVADTICHLKGRISKIESAIDGLNGIMSA